MCFCHPCNSNPFWLYYKELCSYQTATAIEAAAISHFLGKARRRVLLGAERLAGFSRSAWANPLYRVASMMKGSAYGAERLAGSAPLGLGSAKYAEAGCCARLDNGSCRTPGFTWTTSKPQAIGPDGRGTMEARRWPVAVARRLLSGQDHSQPEFALCSHQLLALDAAGASRSPAARGPGQRAPVLAVGCPLHHLLELNALATRVGRRHVDLVRRMAPVSTARRADSSRWIANSCWPVPSLAGLRAAPGAQERRRRRQPSRR